MRVNLPVTSLAPVVPLLLLGCACHLNPLQVDGTRYPSQVVLAVNAPHGAAPGVMR